MMQSDQLPRSHQSITRWLVLAAVVAVVDQITKRLISGYFAPGESFVITPFFNLVLAFNTGAAFSFLADAGGWQRGFFIGISVVAVGLITHWLHRHRSEPLFSAGLGLILGGALGNLHDRIVLGHVIDFLLFHWNEHAFPAFNVADSAITVGAGLIILDSFVGKRTESDKVGEHAGADKTRKESLDGRSSS